MPALRKMPSGAGEAGLRHTLGTINDNINPTHLSVRSVLNSGYISDSKNRR